MHFPHPSEKPDPSARQSLWHRDRRQHIPAGPDRGRNRNGNGQSPLPLPESHCSRPHCIFPPPDVHGEQGHNRNDVRCPAGSADTPGTHISGSTCKRSFSLRIPPSSMTRSAISGQGEQISILSIPKSSHKRFFSLFSIPSILPRSFLKKPPALPDGHIFASSRLGCHNSGSLAGSVLLCYSSSSSLLLFSLILSKALRIWKALTTKNSGQPKIRK